MMGSLINNVQLLKNIALRNGEQIRNSNKELEEMNKKYAESNDVLGNTMKKLGDVFSANSSYFCYLIIFIILLFFFLYKIS
jgi:predicted PurR-regulated permease PerM